MPSQPRNFIFLSATYRRWNYLINSIIVSIPGTVDRAPLHRQPKAISWYYRFTVHLYPLCRHWLYCQNRLPPPLSIPSLAIYRPSHHPCLTYLKCEDVSNLLNFVARFRWEPISNTKSTRRIKLIMRWTWSPPDTALHQKRQVSRSSGTFDKWRRKLWINTWLLDLNYSRIWTAILEKCSLRGSFPRLTQYCLSNKLNSLTFRIII